MIPIVPLFIAVAVALPGVIASGTTPHIREIFVGRCEYFKRFGYNASTLTAIDCSKTWSAFLGAFAFKPHCDVRVNDFDAFFRLTKQKLPAGKTAFWSGTQRLSQLFANEGERGYTVRQTLSGFLVDELTWCGSATDPTGLNFTECPPFSEDDCTNQAMTSFWGGASRQFATQSMGSVYLLLNGSRSNRTAFVNTSFFAQYELPNVILQETDRVQIIVANTLSVPPKENCTTGSLLTLKQALSSRNFRFTCEDNPPVIRHLLCGTVSDPAAYPECQLADNASSVVKETPVSLIVCALFCLFSVATL